jgi:branched-chain amino acid transport system permease protein
VVQALGALISPQISILAGHLVFLAVLGWRLMRAAAADRGGWRAALSAMFNKPDLSRRQA